MVHYVVLLNYLEKGVSALKASPGRAETFRQAAQQAGAKVESVLWTQGPYDGVFHLSAPDETVAAALVLDLAHHGNVRTTMMRAYDGAEFQKVLDKLT